MEDLFLGDEGMSVCGYGWDHSDLCDHVASLNIFTKVLDYVIVIGWL